MLNEGEAMMKVGGGCSSTPSCSCRYRGVAKWLSGPSASNATFFDHWVKVEVYGALLGSSWQTAGGA